MKTTVIVVLCLVLLACTPVEQQARNTAAALQGAIVAAQAKYQPSCLSNPQQTVCVTINQGVSGENALITATETYCGWSTTAPPTDPNAKCVPVKTAAAALSAAISNATALTLQLKGVLP